MYKTRIQKEFDLELFDKFWDDSKDAVARNLKWDDVINEAPEEEHDSLRREYMIDHYKSYFGIQGKLKHRFVFTAYHVDHPEHDLFYTSVDKRIEEKAAYYNISLYRKDLNGSRAWIHEFYRSGATRPMIESMGLNRWYTQSNPGSDFSEKSILVRETDSKIEKNLQKALLPEGEFISSLWGWEVKKEEE